MTRLSSYRQKQFTKRAVYFAVGIIALLILISTVGFNFLIKSSLFIGELGSSQTAETTSNSFFGSLDVDTPPIATNSAKLVISGSVTGYDLIDININNKTVKTIKGKSTFSETVGDLRKGDNEIEVVASLKKDARETRKESYTVQYLNEKPKLEVSEPSDGATTSNTEIKVAGKTDPNITIRVNDSPTVVDVQGNFQTFVRLKDGENKIKIVATDIAGNTEMREITVRYSKDG